MGLLPRVQTRRGAEVAAWRARAIQTAHRDVVGSRERGIRDGGDGKGARRRQKTAHAQAAAGAGRSHVARLAAAGGHRRAAPRRLRRKQRRQRREQARHVVREIERRGSSAPLPRTTAPYHRRRACIGRVRYQLVWAEERRAAGWSGRRTELTSDLPSPGRRRRFRKAAPWTPAQQLVIAAAAGHRVADRSAGVRGDVRVAATRLRARRVAPTRAVSAQRSLGRTHRQSAATRAEGCPFCAAAGRSAAAALLPCSSTTLRPARSPRTRPPSAPRCSLTLVHKRMPHGAASGSDESSAWRHPHECACRAGCSLWRLLLCCRLAAGRRILTSRSPTPRWTRTTWR